MRLIPIKKKHTLFSDAVKRFKMIYSHSFEYVKTKKQKRSKKKKKKRDIKFENKWIVEKNLDDDVSNNSRDLLLIDLTNSRSYILTQSIYILIVFQFNFNYN